MTVNQFRETDFNGKGGIGRYTATMQDDGYVMTPFENESFFGRRLKISYQHGEPVEVECLEDKWHRDSQGSLRIAVKDYWKGGEYLHISTYGDSGYRGLCVHSNEWGKDMNSEINCDGDAGQSCGYGLFGAYAANE